jgi:DNA helicase HerA-like ATPase
MRPSLHLGARFTTTAHDLGKFQLAAHDLLTHAVIVGMTGSGKTGLVTVMVEEALRNRVPVLVIDVKGDLANLLLAFPRLRPRAMAQWVEAAAGRRGRHRR